MNTCAALRSVFTAVALLAFAPATSWAGNDNHGDDDPLPAVRPPDGNKIRPQLPEHELKQMLREINRGNIENTITTMANFGTRHTESSQTDPNQGIGAAITFVFNTLQGYAAASGGRMTVELQTYHQPPVAGEILNPAGVDITNVVATLKGSLTPERIYVISGHMDSRRLSLTDPDPRRRQRTTMPRAWRSCWSWREFSLGTSPSRPSSSPPSMARRRDCSAQATKPDFSRPPAPTSKACSPTTLSGPAGPRTGHPRRTAYASSPKGCRRLWRRRQSRRPLPAERSASHVGPVARAAAAPAHRG